VTCPTFNYEIGRITFRACIRLASTSIACTRGIHSFIEIMIDVDSGGSSSNGKNNSEVSEMGIRGDRATGCAAGTDLYEGNTSPFQVESVWLLR
jgi:hypothetical protein